MRSPARLVCSPTLYSLYVYRPVVLACALGLLPAAACAGGSSDAPADVASHAEAVVNGDLATRNTIHGTVSLVDADQGFSFCTGTLITPDVVMTAAHCLVLIDEEGHITGDRPIENILVIAGVTRISDATQSEVTRVADARTHPTFAQGPFTDADRGFGNLDDIGVILLRTSIETIEPVPVLAESAVKQRMIEGGSLIVEGYGTAEETGQQGSGVLRLAQIPLVELGADEFIAGREGGADACPGDSGGPVYLQQGDDLFVVGVVSRSLPGATTRCGGGGIYTLASAYLDFLGANADVTVGGDVGGSGSAGNDDGSSSDSAQNDDEGDDDTSSVNEPSTAADASNGGDGIEPGTSYGRACSAVPYSRGESSLLAMLLWLGAALWLRSHGARERVRARRV
jgi:secreted trypsin-like serine protease